MIRSRRLLPFEFHGEVRPEQSYEELAILVAAAKRARSMHQPTLEERRKQAKAEQDRSGIYVRIERPVVNYDEFRGQMGAWYVQQTEGNVARTKLGIGKNVKGLELTLLDTRSQTVGQLDDSVTQQSLENQLRDVCPSLFETTGRIAHNGLELFGNNSRPWVALTISAAARSLEEERRVIREVVAPQTRLMTDHISTDRLHMSLGNITVHDTNKVAEVFETLKAGILPVLPEYIVFSPARITVEKQ